jgi:hexosaminidase
MRRTARTLLPRIALVCGLTIMACPLIRAQEPKIQVIPAPKKLERGQGTFKVNSKTRIVLADPKNAEDRFAASDFIDDLKKVAGLDLRIGSTSNNDILIGTRSLSRISAALAHASASASQIESRGDEGYVILVTPGHIVVAGNSPAGTFYGLQTLKQLVRGEAANASVPALAMADWPTMRWRGVSDDISRGPVPTVDFIKRQIRNAAFFKLNMHSFYMEHTFASESHPLIGPPGGSLTPSEIRDLVAYARQYHIELVPEQQTFGHLHKALRLEKYAELAETPYGDVLSPQQEGSYKLISDWYKEINELFPSQFFHIGADETFELGEGQSREAARTRGVGAVYFEHLHRVRDLLKPYNRRLMFWGDIALRHPELIGNVPKDMIVMNWQYGARDDYSNAIDPFKNAGLDQFVCPSAQNYNQVFPNLDGSSKNIINFVSQGQRAGALGMLNTTWDDDGEALFEMTWYSIVLGAAASWQEGAVDQTQFDRAYDWAFFRNEGDQFVKATRDLGSLVNLLSSGMTTDDLFWRDPFTTQFQNVSRNLSPRVSQMRLLVEDVTVSLSQNRKRARRNPEAIPAMEFAARRYDHLGRRMQVVIRFSDQYWDAYLNLGDRAKARRLRYYSGAIYNNLREMAEELSLLKEEYGRAWLTENRPYWLDSVLARYDQMIAIWLGKSRAMEDTLRRYDATFVLPNPEEFGMGTRVPVVTRPQ